MAYRDIRLEQNGTVATLTLCRPETLNALSPACIDEILDALSRVGLGSARCLILTGEGRGFCSGASLAAGESLDRDLGSAVEQSFTPLIRGLLDLPIPLVTAVNGIAAGAGCSVALAGDIILASEAASFLMAFVNIGLVPDTGVSWLVPAAVGRARAMEMMLLGEKIPADQALHWGLVNRVVPAADLPATAAGTAERLAAGPTRAMTTIRRNVNRAIDGGLDTALIGERDGQREAGRSADFREGVAAFTAKRRPVFRGS